MIKKLTKHGDDLAVVIDRALLEKLGIDESTPLELSTDGEWLLMVPVRSGPASDQHVNRVMDSIHDRYARTFKRLAEES